MKEQVANIILRDLFDGDEEYTDVATGCADSVLKEVKPLSEAPELAAALWQLLCRCGDLDQSATHIGLLNCQAIARARQVLGRLAFPE